MASKYVTDLKEKGIAVNDHGVTVSTVEQSGAYSGQSVGRVWYRNPNVKGASSWTYVGCNSVKQAHITAQTLKELTFEQIEEQFD